MRDYMTQIYEGLETMERQADEDARQGKAGEWRPARRLEWECQCESCVSEDPASWHWNGEYDSEHNRVTIYDRDYPQESYDITLPANVRLCVLEQQGEELPFDEH